MIRRASPTPAALEYANLVNVSPPRLDLALTVESATWGFEPAPPPGGVVPHGDVFGTGRYTTRDADVNPGAARDVLGSRQSSTRWSSNLQASMISGGFDYVALGHYHDFHKHKANAYYAGATKRFGFGEVESVPGFAVVEFEGGGLESVEHVPIETRRMLELQKIKGRELDAGGLTEEIRNRTENVDLDDAIVRLRAFDVKRGVASGVDRELLRDLQRRCLNFSLEIHAEERPEADGADGPASAVRGDGGVRGIREGAAG